MRRIVLYINYSLPLNRHIYPKRKQKVLRYVGPEYYIASGFAEFSGGCIDMGTGTFKNLILLRTFRFFRHPVHRPFEQIFPFQSSIFIIVCFDY